MAEHPVERQADLADLGARVGVGNPLRQRDLAAGQRQLGHPGGGSRDPAQRPQRQPHEPGAEYPGEEQGSGEDDGLDDLDLAQGGVDGGQRQAADVDQARWPGRCEQPVVAEAGQVGAERLVSCWHGSEDCLVRGGQVALAVRDVVVGEDPVPDLRTERLSRLLLRALRGRVVRP